MKFKKIMSIFLVGIIATSIYSCSSEKGSHKDPEVVAKIEKDLIKKDEVNEYYSGLESGFKEQFGEDYKNSSDFKKMYLDLVNQYVDQNVLVRMAKDEGIIDETKIQEQVDEDFENMKSVFANEEAFETALINSRFKDDEDYKNKLKISVIIEELIKKESSSTKIAKSDVETYYKENEDKFLRGPGADVYHIFLNDEKSAELALEELDSGESFEDVALKYGKDGSATVGGYLGYQEFDNSDLVEDFMSEVEDMKEGEIRGPVETQFGYHIIKVENVNNDDWVKSLDDAYTDIEETLKADKTSQIMNDLVEKARKKYKVEIYDENILN